MECQKTKEIYKILEDITIISNETMTYTHALQNFTKAIFNFRGIKYPEIPKKFIEEKVNLKKWKQEAKLELEAKLKNQVFMDSFISYSSRNNLVGESDDLEDFIIKRGHNLQKEFDLTNKIFEMLSPELNIPCPISLKQINGSDYLFLKEVILNFEQTYDVPSDLRKTLDIFQTLINNSQDLIEQIQWWDTGSIFNEFKLIYARQTLDLIVNMQKLFEMKTPKINLPIFNYSKFEIPKNLLLKLTYFPKTLIHGDLNLGNIISSQRNHFFIDYAQVIFAHPLYDVSYFLEQEEFRLNDNLKRELVNDFLKKSSFKCSLKDYDLISIITNQKISKRYANVGEIRLSKIYENKAKKYLNKLERISISH